MYRTPQPTPPFVHHMEHRHTYAHIDHLPYLQRLWYRYVGDDTRYMSCLPYTVDVTRAPYMAPMRYCTEGVSCGVSDRQMEAWYVYIDEYSKARRAYMTQHSIHTPQTDIETLSIYRA